MLETRDCPSGPFPLTEATLTYFPGKCGGHWVEKPEEFEKELSQGGWPWGVAAAMNNPESARDRGRPGMSNNSGILRTHSWKGLSGKAWRSGTRPRDWATISGRSLRRGESVGEEPEGGAGTSRKSLGRGYSPEDELGAGLEPRGGARGGVITSRSN